MTPAKVSGSRRALVTGAASGIGRAVAVCFAQAGYELVLVDRDASGLANAAAEIGGSVSTVVADFSAPEVAAATVGAATGDRPFDVLVNCAGLGFAANTVDTTADQWDLTLSVNLSGTFYMCQLVLPGMLAAGHGVIVNMASAGALVGLRNRVAYCASKAGVLGLTRALAADHAGQGIRVNAICPGTVDSPWIGKILEGNPDPVATRHMMEQRQLDGRMGTPEEVAEWIAFLADDTGRFMNGASLIIDGGLTAV
jgi:NAD(P)-dependent dehydrogenase (short-subunit alcohol dehydrogenase family)